MKKYIFTLFLTFLFILTSCNKVNETKIDDTLSISGNEKINSWFSETNTWVINNNNNETILKEEVLLENNEVTLKEEVLLENNEVTLKEEVLLENNETEILDNITELIETLSWELVENTWNFCILNECIPKNIKVKYYQNDNIYLAKYYTWDKEDSKTYSYKLSKNLDSFEIDFDEMMHEQVTIIKKIWDIYVKTVDDKWCGGSNLEQTVFDAKWKELPNFQFSDIPKEIYIWNVKFIQSLTGSWWFWQPLDSYNKFKVYEDDNWYKVYNDINDFTTFVTNKVINEDKKLYKNYIAQFKQYPWINIMYNSVWYDESSIRVVYLGTDKSYLEKNIASNWDLLDLNITNKIISYYTWKNTNYNLFDKE